MEVLWDPTKARGNLTKHGLAFEDAELALSDPRALTREDSDSRGQQRFVTVAPMLSAGLSLSFSPTRAETSA